MPDFLDEDSDADGIPDADELVLDDDGDGVPAFLDLDDNSADISQPIGNSLVTTGLGPGCVLHAGSVRFDPIMLMLLIACFAGLVRRRSQRARPGLIR